VSAFFDRIDAIPDAIAIGIVLFGLACLALADWKQKKNA
jgi:hypothetical protein